MAGKKISESEARAMGAFFAKEYKKKNMSYGDVNDAIRKKCKQLGYSPDAPVLVGVCMNDIIGN